MLCDLSGAVRSHIPLLLALMTLGPGFIAATCVVVEEGPEDVRYGEESAAEASQEEMADDIIRDSER